MNATPPRLAERLVSHSLAPAERELVLGDLAEEYEALAVSIGVGAARRWYWRQTAVSFVPNLRRRWARRAPATSTHHKGTIMDALLLDVRYALRMIRRRPGLSLVAFASLGIGLSLSTVVFSLLNAVVLRALPVDAPDDLAIILEVRQTGLNHNLPHPDFVDYRAGQRAFIDLACYSSMDVMVREGDETRLVAAEMVSGSYFSTLGVRLASGRPLNDADDTAGAEPVAVVGESLWQHLTATDPRATFTPRQVLINNHSFAIVGVVASPFRGAQIGRNIQVWVPLQALTLLDPAAAKRRLSRTNSWLSLVGRLQPGTTRESAAADLNRLEAALAPSVGRSRPKTFTVAPGRQGDSSLPTTAAPVLRLLLGAAMLVLLVACANVANLLIARATERTREMAVRTALGARRMRLGRLALIETVVLGGAGAAAALLVAPAAAKLLVPFMGSFGETVTVDIMVDWRVATFVCGLAFVTIVLAGLTPVITTLGGSTIEALAEGGRGTSSGPAVARLRRGLVVVQFALSLALVVAALLLSRTVYNLRTLATGLDIDRVALIGVDPTAARLEARTVEYFGRVEQQLASVPGVRAAGFGRVIPLGFGGSRMTVIVPGYTPDPDEDMEINFNTVSSSYQEATGLDLIAGRWFDERDTAASRLVVVVNETMARRYWNGNAVGQIIRYAQREPEVEVIGVVRDVKYRMLREEARPSFYRHLLQAPAAAGVLHVRTSADPAPLLETLRRTAAAVNPDVAVTPVRTLRRQADINLTDERLAMLIAVVLGATALLLAAVGLYGSMAYAVGQRTREIGVRVALGASAGEIRRLVLGQGMRLAVLGSVAGIGLAVALARAIENRLYGVTAADPATLAVSAGVLALIALVASYVPARRAAGIDPADALRNE